MKIPEVVSGSSNIERKLKLWCPPASKTAVIVTGEEQRLDFGFLGRIFGLDPCSLKLNGHFIVRGIDLVSSSVTWISLLNYFSAKGLPTGEGDGHALVVDGKPRKAKTTKRARSNENSGTRIYNSTDRPVGVTGSVQSEDGNLVTHKKLKESNPNPGRCENPQVSKSKSLISKRKLLKEDVCLLKKLKINEGNSDFGSKGNTHSGFGTDRHLKCSYMNGNMKRTREDEVLLTTPCKKDQMSLIDLCIFPKGIYKTS